MAALEPDYDPDLTVLPTSNRSMTPLSARTVAIVALSVLIVTAGAIFGLLWWVNARGLTGTELTAACLDAIKIGLSIAVGGGGIFALYLAWRRQRSNEADHQQRERSLQHQQQVADDTKHDALERRITDLYTKAADQLGSDKAPVRLAGIYALERLAQNNPDQRQTIVNLLCAYLRMPYDPSLYVAYRANRKLGKPTSCKEEIVRENFSIDTDTRDRSIQESEVRLTAQRVLTRHLNPSARTTEKHAELEDLPFWPRTELDLTGAVLIDFDVTFCQLGHAKFDHAQFIGPASFSHAQADLFITFTGATFTDKAEFVATDFLQSALFAKVNFTSFVTFSEARISNAVFNEARFGPTEFRNARLLDLAIFNGAEFQGKVDFSGTLFPPHITFEDVKFADSVKLKDVEFSSKIPPELHELMVASPEPF